MVLIDGCVVMNGIEKYFQYRQSLIDQFVKGDMTKENICRQIMRRLYTMI